MAVTRSNLVFVVVVLVLVACGPSVTPVEAPRDVQVSEEAEAPLVEVPVEAASPADDGADDESAAVIATARAALTARGLSAEWLDGEVQVRALDGRHELRFVPAATTGAPDHVEAFVADGEVGRVWIGGSTWALGPGVRLRGLEGHARHTHGGDAAEIGHVEFELTLERAARLRVREAVWLTSPTCEPDFTERAQLGAGHLYVPPATESVPGDEGVELAPGTHRVTVGFPSQPAYYAYCDRFAARVAFDVGGTSMEAQAEVMVTRVEPYDRH
ncbi:MAG: hypothetical protein H6721_00915 [Sandaracinus sp.]|nr:hypothetical protein [Sandaracinus sp.]MCB9616314.1 hypothetical protein [Sandaracinus sp.]MCB9623642.1 hypothetical protein [Sandaracinus sp.]MCB9630704.1 hypothetical protein [Sandaracinus sp.]